MIDMVTRYGQKGYYIPIKGLLHIRICLIDIIFPTYQCVYFIQNKCKYFDTAFIHFRLHASNPIDLRTEIVHSQSTKNTNCQNDNTKYKITSIIY